MMRGFVFALMAVALAACQTTSGPRGPATPGADRVVSEYRLGTGDQVRLIVFNEDQLSGEFVVDGSGVVSLPLVGEVAATGKTVREFQRTVQATLQAGYLNDPRVSVEVLNYRPYYVLGEVNAPGEFPYSDGLTVLNAIAIAEGFTYRADERRVFIRGTGDQAEREFELSPETPVLPGDTLRIAERFF